MTFFILQIRNILKENLLEFFYKATVFQGYDGFGNRTVKCPLVVLHLMLLGYLMQASDIRCDAGMFCCANDMLHQIVYVEHADAITLAEA